MAPNRVPVLRHLFGKAVHRILGASTREALPNHTNGADAGDVVRQVLHERGTHHAGCLQRPDTLEPNTATLYVAGSRAFPIGSTVAGRFEIVDFLGAGGMGEVYHARDNKLHRSVAVKTISNASAGQGEQKRRLLQEARAASALTHPNVATIYDVGEHQGGDYIAMEYVQGTRLDQLIPPTGLPLSDALGFAEQIVEGLCAAHEAGIIHRDVKPANLVITTSGTVKILDFGVARITDEGQLASGASVETVTITRAGCIIGTIGYMSPEQAEGLPVDIRSDIFSFGCVLYEMISGHCPFRAKSAVSALFALLHDEPVPLRQLNPGIPGDVEALVLRCLQKQPSGRFPSMAAVKAELHKLRAAAAVIPLASRRRGRWMSLTTSSVIAAIMLAGVWWWTVDHNSDHTERTRSDLQKAPSQSQIQTQHPPWLGQLLSTALQTSVVDQAGVIDPESRRYLETYASRMFESSGPQIVYVLLPTVDGHRIEDVAQTLFSTWGIGRNNQNDGLLLMLAIRDRTSRLHVGRGLEYVFPPETCTRILDEMKPALRERRYGLALRQASLIIGSVLHGGKLK